VDSNAGIEGLLRTILALPTVELRVRSLRESFAAPPELQGAALDGICAAALQGDTRAREVMLPLALSLAQLADWDGAGEHPDRRKLRELAERRAWWALERLLRSAPSSEPLSAPELAVPDYGAGRELTVGERRSLARRPPRAQIERLLQDPHPLVVEQLLASPQMTEADVLRLASRRPPHRPGLRILSGSLRWLTRPRVRLALVLQPTCPVEVTVPLLHVCGRRELSSVVRDPALPPLLRSTARELLERSPPWGPPAAPLQ
jgi:hypothetical protein